MNHYIFVTIDKTTGEIINCWEQPTMDYTGEAPILNVNPQPNWEVIQIDADDEIDIIRFNARSDGQAISEYILKNKKVDMISLKDKDKIKIGKLKVKV